MALPCSSHDRCRDCPAKVVCRCLGVSEEDILEAIATHNLQTIQEIRRHTDAGNGCTCCHGKLREILGRFSLELCPA